MRRVLSVQEPRWMIEGPACPIPISDYPYVVMAHGGGGTLMHQLIDRMFRAAFGMDGESEATDSAIIRTTGGELAFTTDSYVVRPRFFPGGNIGSMAAHGTVNDLAMVGAKPIALSVGFILEEGLPMQELWEIVQSMARAAAEAGVSIVTGDTKVVDKGKGDGLFINTSGVGYCLSAEPIQPSRIRPGDRVLVSGDVGRHGMAVMSVRDNLSFESEILSDSAPLNAVVEQMLAEGIDVHCMRDATRGGLASALNELSASSGLAMELQEAAIPVQPNVAEACEILGFDPLYVACEGRFVAIVAASDAARAVELMSAHAACPDPAVIGVVGREPGPVVLHSRYGTKRILGMLSGEQLPRIC